MKIAYPLTSSTPHGFWCAPRLTVYGLLVVCIVAVGVLLVRATQSANSTRTKSGGLVQLAGQNAKPDDADLRLRLTSQQYHVACEGGTEPPFHNAYWDNHAPGIYVDVVSGKPLFSSVDKFDSGTGWPSFTKPLDADSVVEKTDHAMFMTRTEMRSKGGDLILDMSSTTARHRAECVIASTRRRYASYRRTSWRRKDTVNTEEYLSHRRRRSPRRTDAIRQLDPGDGSVWF